MEIKEIERDKHGEKIGKTLDAFTKERLTRFKSTERDKKDKEPE